MLSWVHVNILRISILGLYLSYWLLGNSEGERDHLEHPGVNDSNTETILKEILTQYCAGDKIEKNEMGWACGAYG